MKKAITILFITTLSCINAMAVQSGKCGDNATWVLSDDSVLTISGTGEISEFNIYRNGIKDIVIEDGMISGIGKHDDLLKSNKIYSELNRLQELEKEVNGGVINE